MPAQRAQGLDYKIDTDLLGRTDRIFFVMEGAMEEYAKLLDFNVVLYDTSHGTNPYKLKLGCFTTINENGQTVILAVSLLQSEDDDMFKWAFEQVGHMTPDSTPGAHPTSHGRSSRSSTRCSR